MEIKVYHKKHGNLTFIIDDEDYDLVKDWTFVVTENGGGDYYLSMRKTEGPIRLHTFFHRFILNCPEDMCVDHIDNNTLNNKKENLRIATYNQNAWNRSKTKTRKCHSIYLGVTWVKAVKKWQACIGNKYLGRFDDEVMAAKAYDTEARKLYKEFAKLNFPECTEEVVGVIRQKKSSKYRGVRKDKKTNKWLVSCMVDGKRYTGGKQYETEEEAAKRYDELLIEHGGNPLKLNFQNV